MTTIRQLWQHSRTGEVWAVELDGARVTGACGPLDCLEQHPSMLPHMLYDPELGARLDAAQSAYALARPTHEKRTSTHWGWKELQRWIIHNRPGLGLANVDGLKGFYKLDQGIDRGFVPCGFEWRDVAVRLGAVPWRRK